MCKNISKVYQLQEVLGESAPTSVKTQAISLKYSLFACILLGAAITLSLIVSVITLLVKNNTLSEINPPLYESGLSETKVWLEEWKQELQQGLSVANKKRSNQNLFSSKLRRV